ncbi:hypothetical protein NIES4075_67790 [Tolypothrix sp. NIES-4075]|uniref:hypothetical protein n=1 Tax=Tolypothrix sp. NIES-4075 TaxID=2005459 RepID=UPI000B5CC54E|nr:hypothetical protein [Tolypothrix sp. NIES-4075]GAX45758.1 hypothetical protein NIES4075_67790 [Tolypothrix sp. NIES-4075]
MTEVKSQNKLYQVETNTAEQRYQTALSDAIAVYGYKFGVIYRIYCEETNFSYIGQTKDVYNANTGKTKGLSRIKIHYNALKKGCHPHLKLQAAWDSSKGKSIRHEILEVISRAEDEGEWIFRKKLLSAEKPWQEVYKHHEELAPARHYALKARELKQLKEAGIVNNATFVYFALKLKNPWCDRPIRVKPAEFAVEWNIPESSVYEAIAKLKSSELINIDQAEIIIRWQSDSQQANHSDNPELILENQNKFQDSRMDSDNPELILENQNKFQDSRMDSDNPELILENQNKFQDSGMDSELSENQASEPLPNKDSETPHTIHTYSDFIQTLSEGKRESFLEFGNKKAAELKNPPVQLPLKWIETHFEELRSQWQQQNSTNAPTHCGAGSSTNVHNFESWDASTHEGQYHTLMNLGLAKFCENTVSSRWYEWARAKHPERFIEVPD